MRAPVSWAAATAASTWGGKDYAWSSPQILGLLAACVLSLVLFLRRRTTAAEPVLPLSMFRAATEEKELVAA
ncbi:hypothetical protein [Streptomyces sp. NPDC048111]|uniref:hypothetical protein n=1 Tax=Streptomyces sp. NPDC048111 TaxID=3365500 RepID=UPI0037174E99